MKISDNKMLMVIILSAGRSARFSIHKASLLFSENETFLQHIISQYQQAGLEKINVVINPAIEINKNDNDYRGITFIENNNTELGRLYSIKLGLLETTGIDYCYIQNIDNPFVSVDLINKLYESRAKADFISPVKDGHGGHPVLVSSRVIEKIKHLDSFEPTLNNILETFSRCNVQVEDKYLKVNINTRIDYEKYFPLNTINETNNKIKAFPELCEK